MLRRLRKLLVQEVPEELAVCMFECPRSQCTTQYWATCELRRKGRQEVSTLSTTPDRPATVYPVKVRLLPRRG